MRRKYGPPLNKMQASLITQNQEAMNIKHSHQIMKKLEKRILKWK